MGVSVFRNKQVAGSTPAGGSKIFTYLNAYEQNRRQSAPSTGRVKTTRPLGL